MAQKHSSEISYAQLSLWIMCPHCHAQMNEVTNREAVEPLLRNLKSGMNKAVLTCAKCETTFPVQIANL